VGLKQTLEYLCAARFNLGRCSIGLSADAIPAAEFTISPGFAIDSLATEVERLPHYARLWRPERFRLRENFPRSLVHALSAARRLRSCATLGHVSLTSRRIACRPFYSVGFRPVVRPFGLSAAAQIESLEADALFRARLAARRSAQNLPFDEKLEEVTHGFSWDWPHIVCIREHLDRVPAGAIYGWLSPTC
jgi:hypothetical protein